MSEDKQMPKTGLGRGASLLQRLRVRQEEAAAEDPPISVAAAPEAIVQPSVGNVGRGRALLLNLSKVKISDTPPPQIQAQPQPISQTIGRSHLLSSIQKNINIGKPTAFLDEPLSQQSLPKQPLPKETLSDEPSLSEPPAEQDKPVNRHGTSGTKVPLSANYINLSIQPGKGIFVYEIKYSPEIDSIALRRKLLYQHTSLIGQTKTFDGTLLHLPFKLNEQKVVLKSEHPADQSTVNLTVIFKKEQKMHENIVFFNILVKRILKALCLVPIGRDSYNPKCATPIPQHNMEIWPGYVTAVNEHEGGLKLCLEAKHRVLHTNTVYTVMREITNKKPHMYKDAIVNQITGTSVITRYNNRTYRIDDIAWDKNPMTTFERKKEIITLVDYYKQQFNIRIQDIKQPLLVHRSKIRLSNGESQENIILLVPELCYVTGLTDAIRSDFRIMRDLSAVVNISPNDRHKVIKKFIREVNKDELAKNILDEWGLKMEEDTVAFSGRILDKEHIILGNNKTVKVNDSANWSSAVTKGPLIQPINIKNWCIIHTQNNMSPCSAFINTFSTVTRAMQISVSEPIRKVLRDDRIEGYLNALREVINNTLEIVVLVLPTNRGDKYAAIKKFCCVQMPIPSQVIISKTIDNASKLKAVTEKIALQMNCKLGGALWALHIPFRNAMICGIDVFHGGQGQGPRGSIAGFVASMDKLLTKWYSKICIQGKNQEIVDLLQICFVSAINAYRKNNNCNPDRIIVYRDGVGDGQLETVQKYEVKQLLKTFSCIDPNYKPQLAIVVVQKRINTRIFAPSGSGFRNPSPGTIVDSTVTRRNYYDFFLVSQNTHQGTVSPTHYIVVHDGTEIEPDHMQRITYKLCHLYYNWPGTVRVPAPCQYAHKLAFLVGQSLQTEPNEIIISMIIFLPRSRLPNVINKDIYVKRILILYFSRKFVYSLLKSSLPVPSLKLVIYENLCGPFMEVLVIFSSNYVRRLHRVVYEELKKHYCRERVTRLGTDARDYWLIIEHKRNAVQASMLLVLRISVYNTYTYIYSPGICLGQGVYNAIVRMLAAIITTTSAITFITVVTLPYYTTTTIILLFLYNNNHYYSFITTATASKTTIEQLGSLTIARFSATMRLPESPRGFSSILEKAGVQPPTCVYVVKCITERTVIPKIHAFHDAGSC
ncbi:piwi-like protein Ago3 [Prorops nasuta]|uniref:piwi-like protein Ago3 n=1 Tax=Prorops nasuta TaxID=863751 RepID=UPI0034CD80A3